MKTTSIFTSTFWSPDNTCKIQPRDSFPTLCFCNAWHCQDVNVDVIRRVWWYMSAAYCFVYKIQLKAKFKIKLKVKTKANKVTENFSKK